MQLTNRELGANKWQRTELVRVLVVATVGIFIGLLAPFGMHQLPVYVSITYWVIMCLLGYIIYRPVLLLIESLLRNVIKVKWYRLAIGVISGSALMSFAVPVMSWIFFKQPIELISNFQIMFPKCVLIGAIVTCVTAFREHLVEQKRKLAESNRELEETLQQS